jgi:methylthioribose-1-phosphate isomerase
MDAAAAVLKGTRPTAANLAWAADRVLGAVRESGPGPAEKREAARREAQAIADEDAAHCKAIGEHGLECINKLAEQKKGAPLQILTHCNAGWLAFVDYGSALAPVYAAFDRGIPVHVWVDETRPRNQGASLTAWELGQHGVPHDIIPDNAGGHLMQHGMVDLVITGADRVTRRGDAANKIGTYLKAVAARENGVPFYVALPSSTFDFTMQDGVREIPIEERDPGEVRFISGKTAAGHIEQVLICPETSPARNWGFDVTPARYITGLITERGICGASEPDILARYPEYA